MPLVAPILTEEDQYGVRMPEIYMCDSCKAIMFQLEAGLLKKQPKSRRLKDWEYTDVFEEVCGNGDKNWDSYGTSLIKGENKLTGPGLTHERADADEGSLEMKSRAWTKRLGEQCRIIVYEKMGEEEVYDRFYNAFQANESPGLNVEICKKELHFCKPLKNEKREKKEKKEKNDKKEKHAKKEKKDKKENTEANKKEQKDDPEQSSVNSGDMNLESFFRSMAAANGLTADQYLASRPKAEWEQLILTLAHKISTDAFGKAKQEL